MALNDNDQLRRLLAYTIRVKTFLFVVCSLPGANVNLRRKWETAEVQAIERHLMDYIRGCKVPGKRHCMSCLLSEPVALKHRNWSCIKYYVNNRIVALKRKMSQ